MDFKNIPIKNVKSFWDSRPCNIKHSRSKFGSKKYFDEVEARKYFVEPNIPDFADFNKWNGKKVLEIGCGIGTDTINFARAGARVTAVELSEKSLDISRKRAKIFRLDKRIKFYLANVEELSKVVPVNKYDLIYSFGVIHHTPHPEKAIKELKKYMSKNTVLKIMVYNKYSWKILWIIFKYGKGAFWNVNKLIPKYSEAAIGSPVTYVYSKEECKKLLKDFRIKEIKVDHIFPYIIKDYINYKYRKEWYFRYLPKPILRELEKKFGWHLMVTATLR